jgi:hypothetical protein
MTIRLMRDLAQFHAETAANQHELASRMVGEAAEDFRAKAIRHEQWAAEIRQGITTIESVRELFSDK